MISKLIVFVLAALAFVPFGVDRSTADPVEVATGPTSSALDLALLAPIACPMLAAPTPAIEDECPGCAARQGWLLPGNNNCIDAISTPIGADGECITGYKLECYVIDDCSFSDKLVLWNSCESTTVCYWLNPVSGPGTPIQPGLPYDVGNFTSIEITEVFQCGGDVGGVAFDTNCAHPTSSMFAWIMGCTACNVP